MADYTVKMKLKEPPWKKDRAWFLTFENGQEGWFPFSTINQYNQVNQTVHIEVWILTQKQIKFKF